MKTQEVPNYEYQNLLDILVEMVADYIINQSKEDK